MQLQHRSTCQWSLPPDLPVELVLKAPVGVSPFFFLLPNGWVSVLDGNGPPALGQAYQNRSTIGDQNLHRELTPVAPTHVPLSATLPRHHSLVYVCVCLCVCVCVCTVFFFVFKLYLSRPLPSSAVNPEIASNPSLFLPFYTLMPLLPFLYTGTISPLPLIAVLLHLLLSEMPPSAQPPILRPPIFQLPTLWGA